MEWSRATGSGSASARANPSTSPLSLATADPLLSKLYHVYAFGLARAESNLDVFRIKTDETDLIGMPSVLERRRFRYSCPCAVRGPTHASCRACVSRRALLAESVRCRRRLTGTRQPVCTTASPMSARLGLGLAALGRPGYVTRSREGFRGTVRPAAMKRMLTPFSSGV